LSDGGRGQGTLDGTTPAKQVVMYNVVMSIARKQKPNMVLRLDLFMLLLLSFDGAVYHSDLRVTVVDFLKSPPSLFKM
jgi:hypothetical protein